MSAVQTVGVELIRFPCAPWKTRGDSPADFSMSPVPGTWTLAPEFLCAQGVRGIVCCPNRECQRAVLVRFDMGKLDNGALQLDSFQCAGCGMHYNARLAEWDKRKLFCSVYELLDANGIAVAERKEYTHAVDRAEAYMFFLSSVGHELDRLKKKWRMVDCGLAIGYFGVEKKDKDLLNLTV